MQTSKKNALSYDSTIQLTKMPYLLLQKGGSTFFQAIQRNNFTIPVVASRKINTNYKFGLSKDSPFLNKYTECHALTSSLFCDREQKHKYFKRMLTSTADKTTLVKDSFSRSSVNDLTLNLRRNSQCVIDKLNLYKRTLSLGNADKLISRQYSTKTDNFINATSYQVNGRYHPSRIGIKWHRQTK